MGRSPKSVITAIAIASLALLSQPAIASPWSATLQPLLQSLNRFGFRVQIRQPGREGLYGYLAPKERLIVVNPVVFELGLDEVTLVHEAVHAAQFCAGRTQLQVLGLPYDPPPQLRRSFLRYRDPRRQQLEAEAYAVQARSDRLVEVQRLLNQYCKPR